MTRQAQHKLVEAWNAKVKLGDTVEFREVRDATPQRFTTRSAAQLLSGHAAVVWLNGKSGCVCIDHCKAVAP